MSKVFSLFLPGIQCLRKWKVSYQSQKLLLNSLFVSSVLNTTCLVFLRFLFFFLQTCNKAEEMENFHPPSHEGPHVSHHTLHVHSAPSPSGWLFWFDGCNPTRSASIHGCYMSLSLCSGAARLKKTGRLSRVVFLPSPFKSTLQRTPLWPLMHPVHLARQSCETQDHRHGQKQFHPLIEPISTLHFEEKQESDMCYCTCTIYKFCLL